MSTLFILDESQEYITYIQISGTNEIAPMISNTRSYYKQLKCLNESLKREDFSNIIQTPICILQQQLLEKVIKETFGSA